MVLNSGRVVVGCQQANSVRKFRSYLHIPLIASPNPFLNSYFLYFKIRCVLSEEIGCDRLFHNINWNLDGAFMHVG